MEGMDSLIGAMSNEDLADLKTKYADNSSVATLIDGILETRTKEVEQAKAKLEFEKGLAKTFAKLPHPDDIHNIFVRWGEVDVEDGEAEAVEVNGITEMRIPTHKEYQWVVTVNHATKVGGSASPDSPKTSKRAITIFKRNGNMLEPKGNYQSASKACEVLNLPIGGDSATRVLAREGYILEAYDGTEFAN